MDIQLHRVIQYFPKHVEENLANVHSLHLTNEFRQLTIILLILSSLEDTPDVIVLHVAGNDLGAYEIGDLRYFLRAQLRHIKRNYPNTKLIWSQILPRTNWRHSMRLWKRLAKG
jgi:hypothetical protein